MRKNGTTRSAGGQGEQGFWPSYADMMSAVALILFFLMLLSYISNMITGNNLKNTQDDLDVTKLTLAQTSQEYLDAAKELEAITSDLEHAKVELDAQESFIDEQKAQMAEQQAYIDEQKATIDRQKEQAKKQEKYLADTQKELSELRGQMQTIAVLRLSILEQIKDSIAKVMGDASKVSVGDNGSIILSESILFDLGSATVKKNSSQILDQLGNVFVSFLSDDSNAKYVDSIVISGHTDNTGGSKANRELSTDRANSVLNYLLDSNKKLDQFASYFCAAGYGATRPVQSNNTTEGRAANRRIEISIILKDESVLDVVEEYLKIEMPKG